jgi:hypothetical protein
LDKHTWKNGHVNGKVSVSARGTEGLEPSMPRHFVL